MNEPEPPEPRDPKILVVTKWAPPMIGGPKNLYNLLSLFPKESYCVLTSADVIDPYSAGTGSWLAAPYTFYDRGDGASFHGDESPKREAALRPPWRGRRDPIRRFRFLGRNTVEALTLIRNARRVVRAARRAIREHGITMLLGISDEGPALLGTYLAHRMSGLPYALYLFDLYRGNNFSPIHRLVARLVEPRLLREAEVVVTTNEATEELLRNRYGERFRSAIVHNSAFPEDFGQSRQSSLSGPPFTIVFTGQVYWAQEQAVLNLIRAMDTLRDVPVRLLLYVPAPPESLREAAAGRPNVELTRAPQAEMAKVQCNATLLFLPLSWDTEAPEIIATASPGKLTDYLASCRPILVHAPDYSYIARFTKEHRTGIVVDRNDVQALAGAIRDFLQDPGTGNRYVGNALRLFDERHDAWKNSRKLWSLLRDAAGGPRRDGKD